MKKALAIALILATLGANTALADILPPGQKTVPVCAYFNNINDNAGEMVVFGYEESPVADTTITQYTEGECFTLDYKFNTITIYAVALDRASVLNEDGYDPTEDSEAYPANIQVEVGDLYVNELDSIMEVQNIYRIVELDTSAGELIVEPVQTERYYAGQENPTVVTGIATLMSGENITTAPADKEVLFSDITEESPYYDALTYLKENGKVNGYPDGSFKPNNTINRAEFVKMTVGSVATTEDLESCAEKYFVEGIDLITIFTDVTYNAQIGSLPEWYFSYVCEAKRRGVVGGYPDGSFRPATEINFAEAAKIIIETIEYETATSNPWFKRYVEVLADYGAIPVTITKFNKKITRGEMAEIMYRLQAEVTNLPSHSYADLK